MREPTSKLSDATTRPALRRRPGSTRPLLGALGLLSGTLWACGLPTDAPSADVANQDPLGQHESALAAADLDETTAVIGRPPSLSKAEPMLGPDTGGTDITLTGRNFRPGVRVDFAGTAASYVTVVSSTQLRVSLPAKPGLLGRVPVRITLPDGRFVERADLFAYYSDDLSMRPPRLTPSSGISGLVTGDMDKDGKLDVVTCSQTGNNVNVYLGNGDYGFRPVKSHPGGESIAAVNLADLNGV